MTKSTWKPNKKLLIKDLSLWDENARFPEEYFNKPEKKLISFYLSNEKTYKIKKLAKEIVADIDIPQFEPLLVFNFKNRNIVMEGNRRLAAYKLLLKPSLSDDLKIQTFFKELKAKTKLNNQFKLNTNVTTEKDQAFRYIDRKHIKGNNEISWTSVERDHSDVRRNKGNNKSLLKVEITRRAKALNLDDSIKFSILGKGYETTFWRIIENPATKQKLGYSQLDDGTLKIKNESIFNKILKIIVYNIWTKKSLDGLDVNSRDLNKSHQISDYVKNLKSKDAAKVDKEIKDKKNKNKNLFGEKELPLPGTKAGSSIYGGKDITYKCLINPRKSLPKVSSKKIIEIYKELKIIEVKSCSTATFALVRILTDITIKIYLELKGCKINSRGHLIITKKGENNKTKLKEKMNYIADNYLSGDLKLSVVALNEKLLTQNLNQVMHNTIFCASESQIREFWKNLFPFIEFLWEEIIKLENSK